MCGICGYYSFRQEISTNNILEMNNIIKHRGPDDEGFWLSDLCMGKSYSGRDSTDQIKIKFPILPQSRSKLAIGFRRLSILDLSEKGHQPMLSDNGKISIIFNGEIYNFREIKKELEILGHQFRSTSDTEVILKSYEEWGNLMFPKFDGMFALCLVDLVQQKLILARDRVGLKPLFFFKNENIIVWASEIKSLLKNEFVSPEINWQGVYSNFLFQTTLVPETCFIGIFSVEPATFMSLDLNNFEIKKEKYWSFPKEKLKVSETEASLEIDKLLSKSIQAQLFADVPVISMMSGGIDSTLITSKANSQDKEIEAFTISYPFSEEEVKNANIVAQKNNIKHNVTEVNIDENLSNLVENIQYFEEPYSSVEVLLNAAEYANRKGFKVVLSGNGADELFAGYSHSLKLKKWSFLKNFNFLKQLIFTNDKFSRRLKNYFSQVSMFDFFRQSQVGARPAELKDIFTKDIFSQINLDLNKFHLPEGNNYETLFAYDMKYSLSSHHVFRDDLSAMKYSVEFRYPYLSNALIDYVSTLPENIRYNGKQNKPLLRNVAEKYLPPEVLNMPKKGFSFPLAHFIKNEKRFQDFIIENLEKLKKRNFFNPEVIDEWWRSPKSSYDYVKIWQLVTFELWYQKYFENL